MPTPVARILLQLCSFVLALAGRAQHYLYTNYTKVDGLVSNDVRRFYQDSKGFMWIATWEGLSKFDGYRFTNYNTGNGLSHDLVNDFFEAGGDSMYVAENDGSVDLVIGHRVVKKIIKDTIIINQFYPCPWGKTLVLSDYKGLSEFKDGKIVRPVSQPGPGESYFDMAILNDSLFITSTENSIQVLTKDYQLYAEMRAEKSTLAETRLFVDSKKRIWVGNYAGLKRLEIPKEKNGPLTYAPVPPPFDIPQLKKAKVNDFFEDEDQVIWIATSVGLIKIDPGGRWELIAAREGLNSGIISRLFRDREKNTWIGTTRGISKVTTHTRVQYYNPLEGSRYFIYPLRDNKVLAGIGNQLVVFDATDRSVKRILQHPSDFYYLWAGKKPQFSVITGKRLLEIDTQSLSVTPKIDFGNLDLTLSEVEGENYFLANIDHLYFYSGIHKRFKEILTERTYCLLLDNRKQLWVGTWDQGLYRIRYSVEKGEIQIISRDRFFPGKGIRSLFQDSRGDIWIGTRHNGVYVVNNKEELPVVLHFDKSRNLNSNWVKGIREDKKGNIWVFVNQGIDKLIPNKSNYRVFNFSQVNSYYSTIYGMELGEKDDLWVLSEDGIVHITDGQMENFGALPVYISKISSRDSIHPISEDRLDLKYRHNEMQIEFSSPGFINEKQLLYSYRLLGSTNPDWTSPSHDHAVSYANLRPGDYRFEVRNLGWNGEWGATTSFEFAVLPPVWQTWWFRSICGVLVAGIIVVVVKARIKRIRHEAELKHKVAETEMAALRAQMNPHFIFNSLNSIENFIMQNEKKLASDYLNKFSKLIRGILDSSRNELIPFEKDMELLQLYIDLEQLRFFNKFKAGIRADPELLQGDYKVPSLLIQPYLENAIVHGIAHSERTDLELNVIAELKDNQICYTIEDNGVGREQAAVYKQHNKPHHHSVGLKITGERIAHFNQREHMNGDVVITDLVNEKKQPAGTRVQVTIRAN